MRGKPYGNRLRIKDPNGIETRFVAENLAKISLFACRHFNASFYKLGDLSLLFPRKLLNSRLRKKNMEARNALA
jgi:hypothetical protein